jgi:hypothetical protein
MLAFEFPVFQELLTAIRLSIYLPLGKFELVLMTNSPDDGRSDDIEFVKLGELRAQVGALSSLTATPRSAGGGHPVSPGLELFGNNVSSEPR